MNNTITIIVPFYNTPKEYLDKCMSSILRQTRQNFEIIIVDDGSTEEFSAFCMITKIITK